jgi:hypothetical protein
MFCRFFLRGVEKRERYPDGDPAAGCVDLDEEMSGVAAPMVGPWQRQLNELGGVR